MTAPIVLDVSRLLSRASRRVPTGIDRVEHAYADGLLRTARDRLRYAAVNPLGRFCHLPTAMTRHFVEQTGLEWQHAMRTRADDAPSPPNDLRALARRLQAALMLPHRLPRFLSRRAANEPRPTYLLVSHHHLHQPKAIQAAKDRLDATFVCFIHDLIPIEFPEYNRPNEAAKHRIRIETATQFADAFVVNSESTRDALLPFMRQAGRQVPLIVAPLGVHATAQTAAPVATPHGPPYFLYIGTIEPRKNHLLLFQIWRRLALELGDRCPKLVLVGQRGWENEMVLDVIERSEILRDRIVEYNALPDEKVRDLVSGASTRVSFHDVARRFGVLAHFVADAGFPPAAAGAAGARRYAHFAALCEARRPRFPFVFYGHGNDALSEDDFRTFTLKILERARAEDVNLARAYAAAPSWTDANAFDDRSVPFAIASLSYSRSVTDIVQAWLAAWRDCHGDLVGTPYRGAN